MADLEGLVATVSVELPDLRAEILAALQLLADATRQREHWLDPAAEHRYWDIDWIVRALFDTAALPDPAHQVGSALYLVEVEPIRALGSVFEPIVDGLSDAPGSVYLTHLDWPEVVRLAGLAAATMLDSDARSERRIESVGPTPYADPHG